MKKLLPFIIIILVAVLGIVVAISLNKEDVPASTNNVPVNNKEEEIIEDNTDVKENDIFKPSNKIENEVQSEAENEVEENIEESVEKDVEKTDEEKAVDLVKKEWGTDRSVSFVCTGKNSEGKYIVRVSQGNKIIEWYIVDLENGTCKPR